MLKVTNGKKGDPDPNKEEREAMFNFYQQRKVEKYNPFWTLLFLVACSWLMVYGAFQAVMNYVVPFVKMLF